MPISAHPKDQRISQSCASSQGAFSLLPLPKGSQLRTIEEHSSPEEIARVRTLLACHRSTITDAVPEEFKPLIVGEWAAAFSRLPPLSKAFPPEIRAEHTQLQSSAWALRKFLEPGGSSHTGVNDDLMQQIRAARLLPTAHPLTHIPRHQVIVRETLSDLILEYLRLSGPEKLNKFLSFGEKIFELAIIDKNSLGVDQCELVDPFKGFQ
ncbi:MAG: hypothetical protein DCC75_13260, partial [Proteobacteria bacterium]